MRKLFGASAKMIYRDKQALFWALAFPVIFAVVFGLFDFEQTPEVKIDLVGETASPVFGAMEQGLGSIETFVVTERADLDASAARLDDGDTDVVIAVEGTGVDVLYDETNFQTNQFAITAIERIVDRVNLEAAGVSEPMVSMDARGVASSDVSYYDFLLPGLVAMGVGDHGTAGTISFLLKLGGYLEEWTKQKSSRRLADMFCGGEGWAWIKRDGKEARVGVKDIAVGDLVVVRAGGRIPVDGVVVEGEAMVNQSSITGEPWSVPKRPGITVYAGTALSEGRLVVSAVCVGSETKISKIVKIIQEAESFKAEVQSHAEKLAVRMVPYSFLLSGLACPHRNALRPPQP
jgi:hypothetical protein